MKRILACLFVICSLSTLSPAPIADRSNQFKAYPEQSQDILARQQQLNGTTAPVGIIQMDTDAVVPEHQTADPDGRDALAAASIQMDDPRAKETLRNAKGEELHEGGWAPWIVGAMLVAFGFACVTAFKVWADKKLVPPARTKPQPPKKQEIRW